MIRKLVHLPVEILLFVCAAILLGGFLAIMCLAVRKPDK